MYKGGSSGNSSGSGGSGSNNGNGIHHQHVVPKQGMKSTSSEEENSVLHMKKSAEIAAVFSGAKINQTTDLVDPHHSKQQKHHHLRKAYSPLHPDHGSPAVQLSSSRHSQENFSEADMHSSLGYFP